MGKSVVCVCVSPPSSSPSFMSSSSAVLILCRIYDMSMLQFDDIVHFFSPPKTEKSFPSCVSKVEEALRLSLRIQPAIKSNSAEGREGQPPSLASALKNGRGKEDDGSKSGSI